jgi:hypothetical protein
METGVCGDTECSDCGCSRGSILCVESRLEGFRFSDEGSFSDVTGGFGEPRTTPPSVDWTYELSSLELDQCHGLTGVLIVPTIQVGESGGGRMKRADFNALVSAAAGTQNISAEVLSVSRLSDGSGFNTTSTPGQEYIAFDEPLVVKISMLPIPKPVSETTAESTTGETTNELDDEQTRPVTASSQSENTKRETRPSTTSSQSENTKRGTRAATTNSQSTTPEASEPQPTKPQPPQTKFDGTRTTITRTTTATNTTTTDTTRTESDEKTMRRARANDFFEGLQGFGFESAGFADADESG